MDPPCSLHVYIVKDMLRTGTPKIVPVPQAVEVFRVVEVIVFKPIFPTVFLKSFDQALARAGRVLYIDEGLASGLLW